MGSKTGKKRKPARKIKKRVPERVRRAEMRKLKIRLTIFAVILVVIAAAAAFFLLKPEKEGDTGKLPEIIQPEITDTEAPEKEDEDIGGDVLAHITTAGNAVWESFKKRPESHELTAENTTDFTKITKCRIDPDTKRISISGQGDGIPKSDDKYYYLFAMNTYEEEIAEGSEYLARDYKDSTIDFSVALNHNLSGSRLYKKFAIAVKKDGNYVQVSTPSYLTNPEAIAKYTSVFQQPASIKGLLVDPNRLRGNELDDLGVKQAAYNIPVARLLGPSSSAAYPTIQYTYNGRTYSINGQVVAEYDLVFGTLTAKGITTTAIILNN